MLLTCKTASRHDKDTFASVVLALCLIDTSNGLQWEGIALRAPGASIHFVVIIAFFGIEEVGVSRVHPPSISAVVVECLQVFPIDASSFGTESIIDFHARGIFHDGRPNMRDTTLRPCFDGKQQTFLIQFAELLRLRTETCPNRNHEMSMLLVYVLYHLFAIAKVFGKEVHGIP